MRDILLTVIIGGLLPVAAFNPYVGVLLWTWISVMNPHRLTFGFAYDLPFAQAAAIATLIGLILKFRDLRFPVNAVTLSLIAFTLWINVTTPFAIHFDDSLMLWSRVNKTLIMTLVAIAVVRSEKQIRLFLWVFVLSVVFFGVKGGIFTIISGAENRVYGPPGSHIEDNNGISIALLMMIPLMVYLQNQGRNTVFKLVMLGSTLLCGLSVVASYSRGAFVAGAAMLGMLALKSRRRVLLITLMAAAVPVILLSMPEKWWDRMNTIQIENADTSIQGRFNAWAMAWNLAKDRPIFGGGFAIDDAQTFAMYAPVPDDVHSAHSIYFQVLGQHGFVGLAFFLLLALFMWRTGTRIIRDCRDDPELRWRADLARALHVSMVAFFVGGLTVNIAYWDVYYFETVMLLALERLPRPRPRAVKPDAVPRRATDRPSRLGKPSPTVSA